MGLTMCSNGSGLGRKIKRNLYWRILKVMTAEVLNEEDTEDETATWGTELGLV